MRHSPLPRWFLVAIATTILVASAHAEEIPVDVELQLLVDVSGSVSRSEFELQMQGYVQAFQSQAVQDAILSTAGGRRGQTAVQLIYWSGASQQRIGVDWFLVDSAESSDRLAQAIDQSIRPYSGLTAPGSALDYGVIQFADNGYAGDRLVIDISSDGIRNSGTEGILARDNTLAVVDTINAITIETDFGPALTEWYRDNIIGGDNSFVMPADDFADFGDALILKLAAEIEGSAPPPGAIPASGAIPLPAAVWALVGFVGWQRRRRRTSMNRGLDGRPWHGVVE